MRLRSSLDDSLHAGESQAAPVRVEAEAVAKPKPSATEYLANLKAQQETSLLMQSNPRDQAYFQAQAEQAAAAPAPAPPPAASPPAYQGTSLPVPMLRLPFF